MMKLQQANTNNKKINSINNQAIESDNVNQG